MNTKFKRILSALMSLAIIAGFIPGKISSAYAAVDGMPDTIYNTSGSFFDEFTYSSDELGDNLRLRYFYLSVDGQDVPAYCYDHSKSAFKSSSGYSNPTKVPSNHVMTPFLDQYMTQFVRNKAIEEAAGTTNSTAIKQWLTEGNGEPYGWGGDTPWYWYWSEDEMKLVTASSQASVWFYATGRLTDSSTKEEICELVGTERWNAVKALGWDTALNISYEATIASVTQVYSIWENGGYDHFEYYVYYPNSTGDIQPVLVPKINVEDYFGYIKLKKTDETGAALPGATFGIYSDEGCKDKAAADIVTTTSDWNYSGKVQLSSSTQTLYVKEISAPEGYRLRSTVYPVTVSSTANATQATAAAVNSGNAIVNSDEIEPPTGEGVIFKVDAYGNAIGPATFNLLSLETGINKTVTSDSNGIVSLQCVDPTAADGILPGEYAVTETVPPPGYVASDEVQNIRFWVEYIDDDGDPDTEAVPMSYNSGPLTFTNDKLRTIKVMKTDANGAPLSGAKFQIFQDGTSVGYATTGSDGSFTFNGLNGDGVDSGHYQFVEVEAPAGYLIPNNNTLEVTVDVSDPSQPETIVLGPMVNYAHPSVRMCRTK